MNWANSLLDIQIDEVLKFVANNDLQKISNTILDEFAALKQRIMIFTLQMLKHIVKKRQGVKRRTIL